MLRPVDVVPEPPHGYFKIFWDISCHILQRISHPRLPRILHPPISRLPRLAHGGRNSSALSGTRRAPRPSLREGLAARLSPQPKIHLAEFRTALAALGGMPTPEVLLINLSGEDQPVNAVSELAEVVAPGTTVLVIGEIHNVNFYRTVTKGMGVREYLPKPLTGAAVTQAFLPVIVDMQAPLPPSRAGQMVTFCGARGGAGTTTVATNLAWLVGTWLHRHTAILDAELHTGTVALNCNLAVSGGLVTALETPERLDALLIERAVRRVADRVDVLASRKP